jgi:hypothetical protein
MSSQERRATDAPPAIEGEKNNMAVIIIGIYCLMFSVIALVCFVLAILDVEFDL